MNDDRAPRTILLVEDETLIALAEAATLRRYGFEVVVVSDGEKAIVLFHEASNIDLILMDIDLGRGIDGTQAAEQILKRRDCPLIFLSSHAEREIVEKTEGISSYGYIVKNSGETVLIASIKMAFRLFESRRKESEKEEALRESRERLALFMNSASDSFYLLDSRLHFVEINDRGLEIMGKKREEVLGRDIRDLVPDIVTSGRYERHLEVLRTGKPYVIENFVPHPVFGNLYFVLKSFKVGDGLGVTASDITESKRAEQELSEANERLKREIADRENAEIALRNSEEKFSKAFKGIPEAVTIASLADGRYIDVNDAFLAKTGYRRDEVIGHTSAELGVWVDPDDRRRFVEELARNREMKEYAVRYRMRSGELRDFLVSSEIIELEGRECSLNFILDVTERKRVVEALRESEDKFKYVFDYSPVGKSITMITGEISVNKAFCDMLGYTEEELRRTRWQDLTHPDDIELTQRDIDALLGGAKASARFVKRFIHKNGSVVWVDLSSSLRRDAEGKPLYLMSTLSDISDRVRAEQKLQESEARYRFIAENTADVIWTYNLPENRFTFVSDSVGRMRGYTAEEVMSQTLAESLTPESLENVTLALQQGIERREPGDTNLFKAMTLVDQPRKDGSVVSTEVATSVVFDRQGRPIEIIGVTRDITERKKAEAELRMRMEELESWHKATLGREGRVMELKEEVNRLLGRLGLPPRYGAGV